MTDINGIVEEQISRWEATRFYVENDFPFTLSKGNPIIDEIISAWNALRAVVELIQEKQKFLEETKGDIPMTNQQLGAREERTKLLAEIIQAIEKELE